MEDIKTIETTALTVQERAKGLIITDSKSYTEAAGLLKEIASWKKQVKEHHRPTIDAAYKTHREAVAAEKRGLEPLDEADKLIRTAIGRWNQLQAIEKQKREDEARKAEEERRLNEAVKVEASGAAPETVNLVLDTPKEAPAFVPVAPTVAGISTRETWSAEVTSLVELCAAVARGDASIEAVQPNMKFLNERARMYKAEFAIPGVKAVKETGIAVRG
jgi:hypothetical protein